jgi:hypothetical protein
LENLAVEDEGAWPVRAPKPHVYDGALLFPRSIRAVRFTAIYLVFRGPPVFDAPSSIITLRC